ncbi:MAG TPA: hypothetical protein VKF41_09985 [Bryobacteraceae bacterium]|nr:hypothetical protein [Bryobacteraceae bacterium]
MAIRPGPGAGSVVGRVSGLGLALFLGFASLSPAQDPIRPSAPGGQVRLLTSDAAILEAQDTRKDLPCSVTPARPSMGFDFKFHSGYDVAVNLKELAGSGELLTIVFRVVSEAAPQDPLYFSQHFTVPAIADEDRGPAFLQGAFELGEGKYHVDWMMRDRTERVCSSHWDSEASLPPKDKPMALDIAPGTVQPEDPELFRQDPPVAREPGGQPLRVKVVLNFAPQDSGAATLQPIDSSALVSILRNISRDPRIGRFSVVAYNMQSQRVLYRQQAASQIDFPALGRALNKLNLGTVDLKHLAQKHGESEFLGNLLTSEVKDCGETPDAVIFAGPKVMLDDGLPPETLHQLADVKFPVFYMNYNLYPQANPWRDAIGSAVRALKGIEFTISRPRDLFFAWSEIMGRIVKLKVGSAGSGNSSPQ